MTPPTHEERIEQAATALKTHLDATRCPGTCDGPTCLKCCKAAIAVILPLLAPGEDAVRERDEENAVHENERLRDLVERQKERIAELSGINPKLHQSLAQFTGDA